MTHYVLIGLGVAAAGLAGLLGAASRQPGAFRLERSVTTSASAEDVYRVISDFRRFRDWSPWQDLDPNMTSEFQGEQGTVGANYSWTGNNKVGAGRMTLTEAVPRSHVTMTLEFFRPFAATNTGTWRVLDEGLSRRIVWTMEGSNDTLFKRTFALVMSMDKLVGKDFEKGLARLKALVEQPA